MAPFYRRTVFHCDSRRNDHLDGYLYPSCRHSGSKRRYTGGSDPINQFPNALLPTTGIACHRSYQYQPTGIYRRKCLAPHIGKNHHSCELPRRAYSRKYYPDRERHPDGKYRRYRLRRNHKMPLYESTELRF